MTRTLIAIALGTLLACPSAFARLDASEAARLGADLTPPAPKRPATLTAASRPGTVA